jgi:hypothetical protein
VAGRPLPWYLDGIISTLAAGFTPGVLLLGGISLKGAFVSFTSLQVAAVPVGAVAFKSLLLPITVRVLTAAYGGDSEAQSFAFQYGLLPCASASLVIARSYGIGELPPLMPMLCSGLGLGKLVSFVLLFIFAALQRDSTTRLYDLIADYSDAMHVISIFGVVWLLGCISQVPAWRTGQGLRASVMFALQGCFSVAFLSVGQVRILEQPGASRLGAFGVVSFFRWANSFYILCLGVSLCVETRNPGCAHRKRRRTPRGLTPCPSSPRAPHPSPLDALISAARALCRWYRPTASQCLAIALTLGAAVTLPWCFCCGDNLEGLALWIPFPSTRDVFAGLYGLLVVVHAAFLVYVLRAERRRSKLADMRRTEMEAQRAAYVEARRTPPLCLRARPLAAGLAACLAPSPPLRPSSSGSDRLHRRTVSAAPR